MTADALGIDRLAALARLATAYGRARQRFHVTPDRADEGADDLERDLVATEYGEALRAFEGAADAWETAADALGGSEPHDPLAVVLVAVTPLLDELRRLRRRTAAPRPDDPVMAPWEARERCRSAERSLADVRDRYGVLHDSGWQARRSGDGTARAQVHEDGTPRDLSDVLVGAVSGDDDDDKRGVTERVRTELQIVTRTLPGVLAQAGAMQSALSRAERLVDVTAPVRADWSHDRQRDREVERPELIVLKRRQREHLLPPAIARLEAEIARLEAEERAERSRERAAAAVARKAEEKAAAGKGTGKGSAWVRA